VGAAVLKTLSGCTSLTSSARFHLPVETAIIRRQDASHVSATHSRHLATFAARLGIASVGFVAALFAAAMLSVIPSALEAASLTVALDRDEIYEGESVQLIVTIRDAQDYEPPDLSALTDFQVGSLGDRSMNASSVIIINGRRTDNHQLGHKYFYKVTPNTTGLVTLPSISAIGDGERLTSEPIALRVKPADSQDAVRLEVRVEPSTVYPTQPFTVTVHLLLRELPGEYASNNPLQIKQREPPRLEIPWLQDENLPATVVPTDEWKSVVEPLLNAKGWGVQLNNFQSDSGFSIFQRQVTTFLPKADKTARTLQNDENAEYWRYSFRRTFVARSSGTIDMSRVEIKGDFVTDVARKRPVTERIYAFAAPAEIRVKAVPVDGRPKSYLGVVGPCQLEIELTPRASNVGDPLTLTFSLQGEGTVHDARAPDLAQLPEIAERFRLREPTSELTENGQVFTYSLRALDEAVDAFPSIEAAYFDVDRESFVALRTDPIPLEIRRAEKLDRGAIVSSSAGVKESANLETAIEGIFANDSALNSLRNDAPRLGPWAVRWGGILGAYGLVTFFVRRQRELRSDPARLRRRQAAESARSIMGKAQDGRFDVIHDSLVGLVADVADLPAEGLTPRETYEQAVELGIEPALAERLREVLEQCDAQRYARSTTTDDLTQAGRRTLDELICAFGALQQLK